MSSDAAVSPLWDATAEPRLTHVHLAAFWRDRGMTDAVRVYEGPDLPMDPGACIVVTWLPGPGFSLEQLLDTPAFQVRTIGPQNNPDEARRLAENVDRAFTAVNTWPAILRETYVVEIRRAGGNPALDRLDDAGRTHYVCTYLADVEAD